MKIDSRLYGIFSEEEIRGFVLEANRLSKNEGKVLNLVVDGWRYPLAITAEEISLYPLV